MVVRSKENGQALILALVAIILSGAMCALATMALQLQNKIVNNRTTDLRLAALDDAALAMTVAKLSMSVGHRGLPEQGFGGGRISSRAEAVGYDRVVVTTVVSYRERKRRSRADIDLRGPLPRVTSWAPLAPLE